MDPTKALTNAKVQSKGQPHCCQVTEAAYLTAPSKAHPLLDPENTLGRQAQLTELSETPQVDLVTPMCTQLTYEGLIDEVFGIKNGVVQLELGADGASPSLQHSETSGTSTLKTIVHTQLLGPTQWHEPRCCRLSCKHTSLVLVYRHKAEGGPEFVGQAVRGAAGPELRGGRPTSRREGQGHPGQLPGALSTQP